MSGTSRIASENSALSLSEQRLRDIIEFSLTGIALASPDGRWLEVNPALCSMLGYSPEELKFQRTLDITHPDDRERDLINRDAILKKEIASLQREKRYIKKDGSIIWVFIAIYLVRDDFDNPEYFVCHIQDITERKKEDEERAELNQRLTLATQAAQIGIWEWNFTTHQLYWDARMFALYGRDGPPGMVYDSGLWQRSLHPEDAAKAQQSFLQLLEGRVAYDTEFRIVWPDGGIRYMRALATLVRDEAGIPLRMVGTNWDITEPRELANQLMAEKERLLETIEKWIAAQQAAEAASQAKSEFLTIMSHELRTPLNAILGFAQLLDGPLFGSLNVKQKDYVAAILSSGEHLFELINDILELSKIEAGELAVKIERVDVPPVMNAALTTIALAADKNSVKLIGADYPSDLPPVLTDPVRLAQAILNLGSNAVKYNRTGGTVAFTCEAVDRDWVRIGVTDTGIGIPAGRYGELFQPFSRLGMEKKAIDGTGVGLALTKRLVELMGGRIGFTSELDRGSCFWIDLPVYTGSPES